MFCLAPDFSCELEVLGITAEFANYLFPSFGLVLLSTAPKALFLG